MTDDIRVRWSGGERAVETGQRLTIGRDPSCDIVIDNPRVSRQHAELRHADDGWRFTDLSSTRGSFLNGSRITEQVVRTSSTVVLGGTDGEPVDLVLAESTRLVSPPAAESTHIENTPAGPTPPPYAAAPPPMPPMPPTPPPVPGPPPSAPPSGNGAPPVGDRPGGSLREEPVAATVVTGASINVQCAGRSYTFQPGREIVVGRDPSCDVRVDNPVVSRRHAGLRNTGSSWELVDYGSSSGTFVEGARVTTTPLRGSVAVYLGPEDVGERMVVVTAGPSAPGRRRRSGSRSNGRLVLVGLIVALAAVAIAVVALLTRNGGSSGPNLTALKQATVQIEAGNVQGSGAVISKDGLILTNAHVVAPDALGRGVLTGTIAANLPQSPQQVQIDVIRDDSTEPAYIGKVVAVDGYLDLAVVRVTSTIGGTLVQPGQDLKLDTVSIGDVSKLDSGDALYLIGYPGIAGTNQATVSDGTVGSFLADARLNDNRAWVNTDANISGGNSGGIAADKHGRLIGTPTAVTAEDRTNSAIGRIRSVNLAKPLIDAARNGTKYDSPYVRPKGDASISGAKFVEASDNPGFSLACEPAVPDIAPSSGADHFAVQFNYDGFPVDTHQDVLIVVQQGDTVLGSWTSADQYPFTWGNGKGCAVANVKLDQSLDSGSTTVFFYAGGNYETLASPGFFAD